MGTSLALIPGVLTWDNKAMGQDRSVYYFLEHPNGRWNESFWNQAAAMLQGIDANWRSRLVRLRQDRDLPEIRAVLQHYGPNTVAINGPLIVKVFEDQPGEAEVFDDRWLQHSLRAFTEDCYPVSGGWWSVDGDWNPSWEKVLG